MFMTIIIFYIALATGALSQLETDDVASLKDLLMEFKREKIEMQKQLKELSRKVNDLKDGTCKREKQPNKRLLMSSTSGMTDSTKVAFFANTVTVGQTMKIHEPLAFGNIITNVGNSYHKETGMFVCTIPGYYAFSANILIAPGSTIRTTIVQNGSVMQQIYSGDPTNHSNGGATVVLHVRAGDLVWVRLETTDGHHVIDWESNFTGFLLFKD